jgi:hypothetical protein
MVCPIDGGAGGELPGHRDRQADSSGPPDHNARAKLGGAMLLDLLGPPGRCSGLSWSPRLTDHEAVRAAFHVDVPLNPMIAGTTGEYLTLVIAAVIVAHPAPDYAHTLAAVLTGWIAYANASAHPRPAIKPRSKNVRWREGLSPEGLPKRRASTRPPGTVAFLSWRSVVFSWPYLDRS